MARDNFAKKTIDTLANRVGVRCSNPGCRKLTTGPREDCEYIVNIGVGAHITGASRGGPRYDESLTDEQRSSSENGIWLCQNCAKLVDNDTDRYTVELLRDWKETAEALALAEVEGRAAAAIDNSADLELYPRNENISPNRHDYLLEVKVTNCGTDAMGDFHVDLQMPSRVVVSAAKHAAYEPRRSSAQVALFRATSEQLGAPIYPGDTVVVLSIPYYMDNDIYQDRGDLEQEQKGGIRVERAPVRADI